MSANLELNRSYLNELYDDDTIYMSEMFSSFLKNIDTHFIKLNQSVESKDREKIKELSHRMKPMYGMVGLTKLSEIAKSLEELSLTKSDFCLIEALFGKLANIHPKAQQLVKLELQKMSAL
jgi:HPt (histidine-containing phosphotransfer) domain-containing protein